jgi:hypothetical protein
MKIDLLALYGAVMGTAAFFFQTRQWWFDRAILKVEGAISIVHTDKMSVILSISAVNNGRKPVSIRSVDVFLTRESVPIPQGLSPERREEIVKLNQAKLVSHGLNLFGGRGGRPIELSPDGGQQTWEIPIHEGLKFLSDSKGGEKLGKASIELTSGKKIFCTFPLLNEDQWPPFGGAQNKFPIGA